MRIFVLGVGATGSLVVKFLLRHGHHVSCGDRDPIRARAFLGERSLVRIHRVNARNVFDIAKAAKGCHLLINTCPAVVNKIVLRGGITVARALPRYGLAVETTSIPARTARF
jgi:saccharopine dehydrogenase-like NADP-dependent oxidoreductase